MNKTHTGYVLLIEPDVVLAKTYSSALQNAGIDVLHVESAQAAITAIDRRKPKLIVLELQLRTHNGVEFLYELRSYSDLKDVAVILLTFIPESTSALTAAQKERLKINGYLYKSHTSLQKLTDVIQEAIAE